MPDAILIDAFGGRTLTFRLIGTLFSRCIAQNAAGTGGVVADADAIVCVAAADAACAIKYFGIRQRRFGACPVDADDSCTARRIAAAAYAIGEGAAAFGAGEFIAVRLRYPWNWGNPACPINADDSGTTSGFAAAAYAIGKSTAALGAGEFIAIRLRHPRIWGNRACSADADDPGTTCRFTAAAYAVGKGAAALGAGEFVAGFGIIAAGIVRFTGTDAERQGN